MKLWRAVSTFVSMVNFSFADAKALHHFVTRNPVLDVELSLSLKVTFYNQCCLFAWCIMKC